MTNSTGLMIDKVALDKAHEDGLIIDVKVDCLEIKKYRLQIELKSPIEGTINWYTLKTQRGEVRIWSDPRNLFEFIQNYGISKGIFHIKN